MADVMESVNVGGFKMREPESVETIVFFTVFSRSYSIGALG